MLVQFGAGGYRSGVRIIIKLEYLRQGFSLAPEKWLIISENLKASWKQNKTVVSSQNNSSCAFNL